MPNPWDEGTAKLLASLGFAALATTSSGHAATLGLLDGSVDRSATLAHATSIVAAVDGTNRWRGLQWVRGAGGVPPRRGRDLKGPLPVFR